MAKNASPFSQDIDDEIDGPPVKVVAPKDPVVDLDADDDDDEEPVGPSRLEKKRSRKWMSVEERERLAGIERENVQNKARADAATLALQQIAPLLQQNRQQAQRVDPIDAELDRADADRARLDREYTLRVKAGGMTEDEADGFRKQAVALERTQQTLIAQKAIRGMTPQTNHAEQAIRTWLVANHPEGSREQRVLDYAEGIQKMEYASGKDPWSPEVMSKAMNAAEAHFKVGKYKYGASREPDPVLRDRYAGAPRSSSGGSGGKGGGARKVAMDETMIVMANAAFPHIKDDAKRYKTWYAAVRDDE